MNNNQRLADLKKIQKVIRTLSNQVDDLIFQSQLSDITEVLKKLKKQKKPRKITTAFLQRKFKIGYAHASRLLNKL